MDESKQVNFLMAILGFETVLDMELPSLGEIKERIDDFLKILTPRERDIIKLRYAIGDDETPHSLEGIANTLQVTRDRVRVIEAKAIRKLQQPSRKSSLIESLQPKQPAHKVIIRLLEKMTLDEDGVIEKRSITYGQIAILLRVFTWMVIPEEELGDLVVKLKKLEEQAKESKNMRSLSRLFTETLERISV